MLTAKKTQNWIPSLFNEFLGNEWVSKITRNASPAVNIIENDNEFRVEMAAPGISKDDIKISVREDNCLVIYMSKKKQSEQEKEQPKVMTTENNTENNTEDSTENNETETKCNNGACGNKDAYDKYLRKEFSVSYFNQVLEIPENVEKDAIDAKFDNGVLVIILPKKESLISQNAKEIVIK
ncbi:MAG: Hsp20/alpha crystallin family protein [Rikenellaceae bacterium]